MQKSAVFGIVFHAVHIFFDVDGVLIRGYHIRPELRVCWDENLTADFGIDRQRFKDEFVFGPFNEVVIGKRDMKEALAEVLLRMGCNADPQAFIDYWNAKDANINHRLLDIWHLSGLTLTGLNSSQDMKTSRRQ